MSQFSVYFQLLAFLWPFDTGRFGRPERPTNQRNKNPKPDIDASSLPRQIKETQHIEHEEIEQTSV